jgi:hypothetical protein
MGVLEIQFASEVIVFFIESAAGYKYLNHTCKGTELVESEKTKFEPDPNCWNMAMVFQNVFTFAHQIKNCTT